MGAPAAGLCLAEGNQPPVLAKPPRRGRRKVLGAGRVVGRTRAQLRQSPARCLGKELRRNQEPFGEPARSLPDTPPQSPCTRCRGNRLAPLTP